MYLYRMRIFLQHVLLWIGIYVVYTYMMSYYDDYKIRMLVNLVNVFLFMIAYYSLKYWQIPYLYDRGKKVAFVISVMATSFVLAAICRINGILWMDALNGKTHDIPFMTIGSYLLKSARFYTPAMGLLALEALQERHKEKERIQQLEREKIATELKFLKAQINPHFLFNTLNNLYSYVLNRSPKAPEMIMQLSGILDFVLYKSHHKSVPIQEEVNTIEHFLKLEQIRYGDRLQVEYHTEGKMKSSISPLILLSLVENAFKHGASGDIDHPKIKIDIQEDESKISCQVWNTKNKYQGELNDAYKEGLGLTNIKRQLNLIYPNQHQLTINDLEDAFSVSLTINQDYV